MAAERIWHHADGAMACLNKGLGLCDVFGRSTFCGWADRGTGTEAPSASHDMHGYIIHIMVTFHMSSTIEKHTVGAG